MTTFLKIANTLSGLTAASIMVRGSLGIEVANWVLAVWVGGLGVANAIDNHYDL